MALNTSLWAVDLESAKATYAALAEFGAPLEGIRPEDFAGRNSFFRFGLSKKC